MGMEIAKSHHPKCQWSRVRKKRSNERSYTNQKIEFAARHSKTMEKHFYIFFHVSDSPLCNKVPKMNTANKSHGQVGFELRVRNYAVHLLRESFHFRMVNISIKQVYAPNTNRACVLWFHRSFYLLNGKCCMYSTYTYYIMHICLLVQRCASHLPFLRRKFVCPNPTTTKWLPFFIYTDS